MRQRGVKVKIRPLLLSRQPQLRRAVKVMKVVKVVKVAKGRGKSPKLLSSQCPFLGAGDRPSVRCC